MKVTIFANGWDASNPHYITVGSALKRIREGASKERIEEIRKVFSSGGDVGKLKLQLPSVVFGGMGLRPIESEYRSGPNKGQKFNSFRDDASITVHSGFFTLDFDEGEPEQVKERLKKDPYIYACWKGPTKGAKALVRCPPSIEKHPLYYNAFLDRYPELDSTSKNIARLCFESWDPGLYVNQNSLVWDKTKTEEERQRDKERQRQKRNNRVIDTAVSMVRASYDGVKHDSLLKAAYLIGGYIATGSVDEQSAIKVLEEEITLKKPKDMAGAHKTIKDGIAHGKTRPLHEAKRIEKQQQFLRREDGSYDFMADEGEMDEYERAVIEGTLQMGLITGMNRLNEHWMFKKNHLVWIAGTDGIGKSFLVWYLGTLAAILHGWKLLIYSKENRDGQVRKKIKEFYIGKSIKLMDADELRMADRFVKEHFRFMTAKKMHTVEDFLLKAELVFDEGWEYDVVIGEPYNAFDVPSELNFHTHDVKALNLMQTFKENYSSLWVCDHVNSTASRTKDKDGYIEAPWKSDVSGGQMKANKTDDFLIPHRIFNDPARKYNTEISVVKVKDVETGGSPTQKDNPVILRSNMDLCGYSCDGVDPVAEYWSRKKGKPIEKVSSGLNTPGWNTTEEKEDAPF